jgi:hypothetical protein
VGSGVHFFIIKYVSWTVYARFHYIYILQHPVCHVCGGRIIQKNMFSCARIVEHDMSPLDSILTSKGQSCVTEMCAEARPNAPRWTSAPSSTSASTSHAYHLKRWFRKAEAAARVRCGEEFLRKAEHDGRQRKERAVGPP